VLQTESSDSGRVAERLIANSLDGVLLATTTSTSVLPVRLRDRRIPFVYFNRTTDAVEADSATVDPRAGLTELAEEIVALGHRRIGAIFGPINTSTAAERERAIRSALEVHDLGIPGELSVRGPFDFDTGYRGTQQLLGLAKPPTVIICGNDVVALGALNAARELGVDVPARVSVVGFDDLPQAAWALVRLATVNYDLQAMARKAASLLVARIEEPDNPWQHEIFPSVLVRRASLAAPHTAP
jgi:LacI family transcriptional regulator